MRKLQPRHWVGLAVLAAFLFIIGLASGTRSGSESAAAELERLHVASRAQALARFLSDLEEYREYHWNAVDGRFRLRDAIRDGDIPGFRGFELEKHGDRVRYTHDLRRSSTPLRGTVRIPPPMHPLARAEARP
jgi:hypothetical protein